MNRFGAIVVAVLFLAFAGLLLLPRPTSYTWQPPDWARVAWRIYAGAIVTCAWAICFRKQLESVRPTLLAVFALVAMQAAFWAAARALNLGY
ncbi:MAG: hypothetical protein U0836_26040 [Pirellulales bacterium]